MRIAPSPCRTSPKRSASCLALYVDDCVVTTRRPACPGRAASELAAERELQAFDLVARLLADRERVADRDRADRRPPQQRDARRISQRVDVEIVRIAIDVAEIHERGNPRRGALDQGREI